MPDFLSHSQLSTLRECGEQYRLKYVEHAERRPYTAMLGGTMAHAATEAIDLALLAGTTEPDSLRTAARSMAEEAELLERAKIKEKTPDFIEPDTWISDRNGRGKARQNLEWFKKTALPNAIDNYINWRENHPELAIYDIPGYGPAIEYNFELHLGTRILRGAIDRIFQHRETGACVITDLKNGAKPKTTVQLGTYSVAMRQAVPEGHWQWGAYLYGLKHDPSGKSTGKMMLTPPVDLFYWTETRLNAFHRNAVMVLDRELFIPNPGSNCERCPFAHGPCDYAQVAAI